MPQLPSIVLDATNQPLGRLASRCAHYLLEKHRVQRRQHERPAQRVVVRNVARVRIAKRTLAQRRTYRTSGYPGRLRAIPLRDRFAKSPSLVLRSVVRGMLPNNRLRTDRLRNLILDE